MAYLKSGTQDPRLLVGPEIRDLKLITWVRPETQESGP